MNRIAVAVYGDVFDTIPGPLVDKAEIALGFVTQQIVQGRHHNAGPGTDAAPAAGLEAFG